MVYFALPYSGFTEHIGEWEMKKNVFLAGVFCSVLLVGTVESHAANWVKNRVDIPNKNLDSNYYDADSIKVKGKTLSWTEKFVLTSFGAKSYTKHLSQYPACRKNIEKKGDVAYHQIDFQIEKGNYRLVAKRNYNKNNELVCTDKDMGTELDNSWHDIAYGSPMYERHYLLVTKYNLGEI
jgi:hypothetical protein